jgi:hypothetical protein
MFSHAVAGRCAEEAKYGGPMVIGDKVALAEVAR